jgi:hypothetical protein
VGRHGDHSLGDPLTKEAPGILHELAQHLSRDLLGRIVLAVHLEPHRVVGPGDHVERNRVQLTADFVVLAADEPLRRGDGALGVEDCLSSGHLAHETLTGIQERHHGRRRAVTLGVGYDLRLTALHGRDHRVRRTQVDAYSSCHDSLLVA